MNFLAPALVPVLWMWMDFVGLILSVASTSFYFGWSTSSKVPLIFLTALFCFSGPFFYFLISRFIAPVKLLKGLILLQFFLYLTATYIRDPSLFPWIIVAGTWVSGMALTGLFYLFRHYSSWIVPWYGVTLGVFLYLGVRLSTQGLALVFVPPFSRGSSVVPWLFLSVSVVASLFFSSDAQAISETHDRPVLWERFYAACLGLLLCPALGMIYNLHIWSAHTPERPAMVYLLSLVLGSFMAWLAMSRFPQLRWLCLGLSLLGLALALGVVLNGTPTFILAFGAHFLGSFGVAVLFSFFIQRFYQISQRYPGYFPIVSLQSGFVLFLFVLAVFLLKSNPQGFWVALALAAFGFIWAEVKSKPFESIEWPRQRIWLFTFAMFSLPGALAFALPQKTVEAPKSDTLTVMTSNIRYGWTDDYRFLPQEHLNYIKAQNADIMAFQEMNKGHTSGAYMDLYQYYKTRLPGDWRYGDANFGFGNALRSQYPILKAEVRTYQAKDILRRSCLISTFEFHGKKIDVYNTHLSHIAPPNPVRVAQAKELVGWLSQSKRPWILMGDFNATPDSPEVSSILKVASPVFQERPELLKELTYSVLAPERRIDYVLFSKEFELLQQEVLDNQGTSDHQVVKSILRLKK